MINTEHFNGADYFTFRNKKRQIVFAVDMSGNIYFGDPTVNGCWKGTQNEGGDLLFQRLVDGTWTTKQTISV